MSESEESDTVGSSVNPRGSKRPTSVVWAHMKKLPKVDGLVQNVECIHCEKLLTTGSGYGTSHLIKHLKKACPNYKLETTSSARTTNARIDFQFDQLTSRKALASMCAQHLYPFNIGYHNGFQFFCKTLQPEFRVPSRNTVRADIIELFNEEKVRITKWLEELDCKVSFTTDIWTSEHSHVPYCCLSCHFIDDKWELQKKVLAFQTFEFPHDGESLFICIRDMILSWKLEKKVFSMVADNASNNDAMIRKLKEWLVTDHLIPFSGELLHVRCSAHILNLIVQVGLDRLKDSIESIRETMRYLKRSPYGRQKLAQIKRNSGLGSARAVALDVPTRWNSTFKMLKTALPLREAFSRLAIYDKNYIFNPTDYEWDVMETVYPLLELFHKATNHFSGRKFPTSNVFFPDICEINLRLNEWKNSDIDIIEEMAVPMKVKFDKYWDRCSLVLAVAVVFDPTRKMQYVEFKYTKIYGSAAGPYIERVRESLTDLFISYGGSVTPTTQIVGASGSGVEQSNPDVEFDEWCCSQSQQPSLSQRSELETYLDERKFPSNESFDVIKWWKDNSPRLPILARIARDILAVPATTVASEAAFSLGGRILDEKRSSMSPDAVEALVVLTDWLELDEMTQTSIARNVESYELDNNNEGEDSN